MCANDCKEIKDLYINQQVAIVVQPRSQQHAIFLDVRYDDDIPDDNV